MVKTTIFKNEIVRKTFRTRRFPNYDDMVRFCKSYDIIASDFDHVFYHERKKRGLTEEFLDRHHCLQKWKDGSLYYGLVICDGKNVTKGHTHAMCFIVEPDHKPTYKELAR